MQNVIKYSDVYERIIYKLFKWQKLNKHEQKIHDKLCEWIGEDSNKGLYSYNENIS